MAQETIVAEACRTASTRMTQLGCFLAEQALEPGASRRVEEALAKDARRYQLTDRGVQVARQLAMSDEAGQDALLDALLGPEEG